MMFGLADTSSRVASVMNDCRLLLRSTNQSTLSTARSTSVMTFSTSLTASSRSLAATASETRSMIRRVRKPSSNVTTTNRPAEIRRT